MSSNDQTPLRLVAPNAVFPIPAAGRTSPPTPVLPPSLLEQYQRMHMYHCALAAERLRSAATAHPALISAAAVHHSYPNFQTAMAAAAVAGMRQHDLPGLYGYKFDPRIYRAAEEPKPQHSYIGLIAMAILSSPEKKLVLSDIYNYILEHYPYFQTRGPGWRNSIRHNLSLNDCFVKSGRSANGKGHYWAIHPANVEDFKKGDFRRRKAQRKVRKHMGLAVEEEDSPSPPPSASPPSWGGMIAPNLTFGQFPSLLEGATSCTPVVRKRQFDVASLLAPEPEKHTADDDEEDIDVGRDEPTQSLLRLASPLARQPFIFPSTPGFPYYFDQLMRSREEPKPEPPASPDDQSDPELK
ncbi:Hypothetical predicted protein [Cloeon dipterum]|uniref:Fork-head domain-containing protein n=1 Tax=Cloeon dipterum TaxID=197152 RepID=A0A8S1D1Q4_9INSE|nr:Hypothetical predicted protein [Cloeon dipterum]